MSRARTERTPAAGGGEASARSFPSRAGRRRWRDLGLTLAGVVPFTVVAISLIATTPFPAPDELEHVSFAAALGETGRWVGQYESQTSLDLHDFTRWSDQRNYVGHPSPYYLYVGRFLDRSLPPHEAVLPPRFASLALIALSLAAAWSAGLRAFGEDRVARAVFAVALFACPQLLATARQVNNDALALLGSGLAYAAVAGRSRAGSGWRLDVAAGAGLALAAWAKPNAGLGVGLFLAAALALRRDCFARGRVAALGAGAVVGAAVYGPLLLRYGTLVPVAAETLFPVARAPDAASFVPLFFERLGATWAFPWPEAGGLAGPVAVGFWLMMATLAVGAVRSRATPARAGLIAFALVLPIHLYFAATRLGFSLPAASFRYYLPLWPALAHAMAATVGSCRTPVRRAMVGTIFAAVLVLGWLG